MAEPARRRRARRFLAYRRSGRIAAAALICAAIGLPVAVATPLSNSRPTRYLRRLWHGGIQCSVSAGARWSIRQGATVAPSSFTMTTSTGQKVTVEEKSSTTYERGTTSTSAEAVAKGQNLLVLGTVNSTTITARQVIVGYKASSSDFDGKGGPLRKG